MTTDSPEDTAEVNQLEEAIKRLRAQQEGIAKELSKLSDTFEAFKKRTEQISNRVQGRDDRK
jgi:predicted nuclease with TOPRIM domain